MKESPNQAAGGDVLFEANEASTPDRSGDLGKAANRGNRGEKSQPDVGSIDLFEIADDETSANEGDESGGECTIKIRRTERTERFQSVRLAFHGQGLGYREHH